MSHDDAARLRQELGVLWPRLKVAEDKVAELTKDKERLDLIEETECYPYKSGKGWTFIIARPNSTKIDAKGTGPTARAAIDAAAAQFPRSSVVEQRASTPSVGSSNLSEGANATSPIERSNK